MIGYLIIISIIAVAAIFSVMLLYVKLEQARELAHNTGIDFARADAKLTTKALELAMLEDNHKQVVEGKNVTIHRNIKEIEDLRSKLSELKDENKAFKVRLDTNIKGVNDNVGNVAEVLDKLFKFVSASNTAYNQNLDVMDERHNIICDALDRNAKYVTENFVKLDSDVLSWTRQTQSYHVALKTDVVNITKQLTENLDNTRVLGYLADIAGMLTSSVSKKSKAEAKRVADIAKGKATSCYDEDIFGGPREEEDPNFPDNRIS
jgi:hypothetical protein